MNTSDWHHAPLHRFVPGKVHMITAGTYEKRFFFAGALRLSLLQNTLLEKLEAYHWIPHAWACFPNHYHVIAAAPEEENLPKFLKNLHGNLSIRLNRMDQISGRKVMYEYWDSCLSFDQSYYARMHYVMTNPVHHGIVSRASLYKHCSAAWFKKHHSKAECNKIASFPCDKLNLIDDF